MKWRTLEKSDKNIINELNTTKIAWKEEKPWSFGKTENV